MVGSPRSSRPTGPRDPSEPVSVRRGAKALLTESGRALLVEERHADGSTFWTLPGGGITPDETAREAIRRELAEELNCRPAFGDPVARFWYAHTSERRAVTRYTVFAARAVEDVTPAPREGIHDARWFRPPDCPTTTLPQVRYLLADHVDSRRARGDVGSSARTEGEDPGSLPTEVPEGSRSSESPPGRGASPLDERAGRLSWPPNPLWGR